MNKLRINIDIVSDVVCPWCFIGKRRMERALQQFQDKYEIELKYHPFELNHEIPVEGIDQKEFLIKKFGGVQEYDQIIEQITNIAAEEGLAFNFAIQKVLPNTQKINRIIWFAKKGRVQNEMVEIFSKAYFEQGIDLSDDETLIALASKTGIPEDEIRYLLKSEVGIKEIKAKEGNYKELGITSVPFYFINNKYHISGAQPTETFVQTIQKLVSRSEVKGKLYDVEGNCFPIL